MVASSLRKYDAFVKTRPDMRSKSAVGGVITLLATTAAVCLFVGQVVNYIMGNPQHSLHLAPSRSLPLRTIHLTTLQAKILDHMGTIPLQLKITFPHLPCYRLDIHHDGASLSDGELSKHHPGHSLTLRKPTQAELAPLREKGVAFIPTTDHGCTAEGQMRIPLVAGSLVVSLNALAWSEVTSILALRRIGGNEESFKASMAKFNVTHYIHYIRFGDVFPFAKDKPLENRLNAIENNFGGLALEQIEVKLVPTTMTASIFLLASSSHVMYQMSVTDHQVQPATLVAHGVPQLPGLLVSYDFSPIAVRHHGGRDNILVFISSLVSIVGGVFVTVGLLTSCLVHSAQVVAKKVD